MIIYKISNNINDKLYIGQTTGTAQRRFERHINDAINNILDTHFARAIRKYGPENFSIEVIDTANSVTELTEKEHYWINYYNSIQNGYNEVDPLYRNGGNTYQSKTLEEMEIIKEKIRASKIGGLNPRAKGIKCKNINTGEEHHFNSLSEGQSFFGESNHNFITRRCRHTVKTLFRNEWLFAYDDEPYSDDYAITKKIGRSKSVRVINLATLEDKTFQCYADAERYYNLSLKTLRGCAAAKRGDKEFIFKNQYKVFVLD